MLDIARKIVTARALAAVFSLIANLVALRLLSSEEYGTGSVAIATAAVSLPIVYQPFSKYVLVSGQWAEIGGLFWRLQAPVSLVVLGAAACFSLSTNNSLSLAVSAGVFAISQGWKEFCGEMARSMGDLRRMRDLYVYDALATAILTVAGLLIAPTAEMFLLSSALSSAFWSIALTPYSKLGAAGRVRLAAVIPVYRYSTGVSVTTFLNSSTLALGRTAIRHASPPELVGAIQFLLDVLQKVVALMASSTLSAVIPEARRRPVATLVPIAAGILGVSLLVMFGLALLVVSSPIPLSPGTSAVPAGTAMVCAVYAWANRYKGSVLDMPLLSSRDYAFLIVPGAVSTLGLVAVLSTLSLGAVGFMQGAVMAMLVGGAVSGFIAHRVALVGRTAVIWMVLTPVVVLCVMVLSSQVTNP